VNLRFRYPARAAKMQVWTTVLLLCTCGWVSLAKAQDVLSGNQDLLPQKAIAVQNRPRPEYDPLGITLGAFRLLPELTAGASYDDNIYATDTNTVGDSLSTVSGSFSLQSLAPEPSLSASGGFTSNTYLHHHVEDYLDFNGQTGVGYSLGRATAFSASGQFSRAHVAREDTGFPQEAIEPPSFDTVGGLMDVRHSLLRGNLDLSGQFLSLNYHDARLAQGVDLSQDFKDHAELTLDLRNTFVVGQTVSAFLRIIHKQYDYKQGSDTGSLNRDATADSLGGGATFEITNLMKGEIGVGVLHLRNHDVVNGHQNTLSTLSNIEVYLTPIITAAATVERATGAANIIGSTNFISTNATARLDYELRRNLILTASFTRDYRLYTGIDQAETILRGSAKARWLLNRSLKFDLSYTVSRRTSPLPAYLGQNYKENTVEADVELDL
jgi:hypothetical protein